ncbi:hypothetical protein LTR17_015135 [Elasticomyces elasticus]|nr:hypothetical protein LTR17_015135 [Elasticomyces elasticus]
MGGGTEWKRPPVVRIMHPNGGSTDVFVHAISKASPVVRSMLDPPKKELKMNITQEGLEVVCEWLLRGVLHKRCRQASSIANLHRLCKAYEAGDTLEVGSGFLDKVLDCIIECVTEADYLKISDIQHIAHALMKIFKEGTSGRRFLCDWLIVGSMERAEHEIGFSTAIARLIQRADGDIFPLSYCRRLRVPSRGRNKELTPPKHILRVECNSGHVDIHIEVLRMASAPIREMLKSPEREISLAMPRNGVQVLARWLTRGDLDARCYKPEDVVDIERLCNAYQAGDILKIDTRFLDEVMDCIVHSVTQADVSTASDIGYFASLLKKTFERGSKGQDFLWDWLRYSNMARAEEDNGFSTTIVDAMTSVRGGIFPLAYCQGIRKLLAGVDPPWERDTCKYHGHGEAGCHRASEEADEDIDQ